MKSESRRGLLAIAMGMPLLGVGGYLVGIALRVAALNVWRRPSGFPLYWHGAMLVVVVLTVVFGGLLTWVAAKVIREGWRLLRGRSVDRSTIQQPAAVTGGAAPK
jgi:hypothetical protein